MTNPKHPTDSDVSVADTSDAAAARMSELNLHALPPAVSSSAVSGSTAKITVDEQIKDLGFPESGSAQGGGDKTTAGLLSAFGFGEPGSAGGGVDNTTAGLPGVVGGAAASPQSSQGGMPQGENLPGILSHPGMPNESKARDLLQHHGQQVADGNDTGTTLYKSDMQGNKSWFGSSYQPGESIPQNTVVTDGK